MQRLLYLYNVKMTFVPNVKNGVCLCRKVHFWPCIERNVLVRKALCNRIRRRGGFLQGMSCVQTAGEMSAACSSSHAIHAWIYEHVESSWNNAGQGEGPKWADWCVLTTHRQAQMRKIGLMRNHNNLRCMVVGHKRRKELKILWNGHWYEANVS